MCHFIAQPQPNANKSHLLRHAKGFGPGAALPRATDRWSVGLSELGISCLRGKKNDVAVSPGELRGDGGEEKRTFTTLVL